VKCVSIVGVGEVDDGILSSLEEYIQTTFRFPTRRLPPLPDPAEAYDSKRRQYSSLIILRDLAQRVPTDCVRLLGITEKDLCIPMLSFVFGQAQLNGTVALESLARLRQEFYELEPNRHLFIQRALKEAVHEMGHTFGLTHCIDTRCPMSLSNTIWQVDRKEKELCPACNIAIREKIIHVGGAAA
jgi:archaemetzincin